MSTSTLQVAPGVGFAGTRITERPQWQDVDADLAKGRVETDHVIGIARILNELATGIHRPLGAGYTVYSSAGGLVPSSEWLRSVEAHQCVSVRGRAHLYTIPPSPVGSTAEISLSLDPATFGILWQAQGYPIHPPILQGPLVLTATAVTKEDPTPVREAHVALAVARASRSYLRKLSETSPDELLALITGGELPPEELTYAVEIAGSMKSERVVETLLPLLSAPSPLVREGTVYGLAWQRKDLRVASALRDIAANDPSESVRDAARGALDD